MAFKFNNRVGEIVRTLPPDQAAELESYAAMVVRGANGLAVDPWGSHDRGKITRLTAKVFPIIHDYTSECLEATSGHGFSRPSTQDTIARGKQAYALFAPYENRLRGDIEEEMHASLLGFVGIRATLVAPTAAGASLESVANRYFQEYVTPLSRLLPILRPEF